MDASPPQDLVGEKIAQPGNDRLVQERGLDLPTARDQPVPQLSDRQLRRIRPQTGDNPINGLLAAGEP